MFPGVTSVTCALTHCGPRWAMWALGLLCDYAVGSLDCGYTSQSLGHQRSGAGTDLGSSSLGFMFGSSRPWPAGRSSCSLSATISKVISSLPCGNRGTWSGAHRLCPMAWRRARPGQM